MLFSEVIPDYLPGLVDSFWSASHQRLTLQGLSATIPIRKMKLLKERFILTTRTCEYQGFIPADLYFQANRLSDKPKSHAVDIFDLDD